MDHGLGSLRTLLATGGRAVGIGLRHARTVEAPMLFKQAGVDWLFVDLEHTGLSLDSACDLCVVGHLAGIPALARVPKGQYWLAARLLDGGAAGIVMPQVDDANEAAAMAAALRYPPKGRRGVTGGQPLLRFAGGPLATTMDVIDGAVLLVAQIESEAGVANVDSIAATDGIDALLIGTNDLSVDLGVPGVLDHPAIDDAYQRTIEACRRHGKWPGMGGVYEGELLARYVAKGMQLVLAGMDTGLIAAGARAKVSQISALPR